MIYRSATKPMTAFYFCNSSIEGRLTGIEHSSFRRAWLFYNHFGLAPHILSTKRSVNNTAAWQDLQMRELVPPASQHLNVYDDLMQTAQGRHLLPADLSYLSDLPYEHLSATADKLMFSDSCHQVVHWRDAHRQQVFYLVSYANGRRIRTDYFSPYGQLAISYHFNTQGKKYQEDLYKVTGERVISLLFNEDQKISDIRLFGDDGQITHLFQNEQELLFYWLTSHLQPAIGDVFFIDKNRVWGDALSELRQRKNITLISTLHADHLRDAYKPPVANNLNSNYKKILTNQWALDLLVLLTHGQQHAICEHFSINSEIRVIPHHSHHTPTAVPYHQRNPNQLIAIGRLAPEKQFDHAIRIMAEVVKAQPEKQLYIYGEGGERRHLEALIKELKLERHVFLPGHTTQITEKLNHSTLFLHTSKTEGFSLVLLESLSHGVPIIAYDCKYGPAAMINDGVNGFLVEPNNIKAAAERVVAFFNSIDDAQQLSQQAYLSAEKFSASQVAQLWQKALGFKL